MSMTLKVPVMIGSVVLAAASARAQDAASNAPPGIAQESPCAAEQTALSSSVQRVADEYQAKIESRKAAYAQQAEQIKRDAEDAKPSTFGAITKIDFDIDWKDQTLIFDLPTVNLRETKIIMGLPQVELKQQKWIYDVPQTRMGRQKVGQHPEITCHNLFDCTVYWKDNYMDVPEFYVARTETVLGVPEFSIREQTLIFGIPEITMQRQKIILGLPQITVKNVSVETARVQDEASAFSREAESDSQTLSAAMQADTQKVGAEKLHAVFACQKNQITANRSRSLAQIDSQIESARAASQSAATAHADAVAKTSEAVVQQLIVTRAAVDATYDDAEKQLDASEAKATKSLGIQQANIATLPEQQS